MEEKQELSLEEMKNVYEKYINNLCKQFKIIEKKAFSRDIAKHIKNRPMDIEGNEVKMQDWNEGFYAFIVKYTSYSIDELSNLFVMDTNLLLTKQE